MLRATVLREPQGGFTQDCQEASEPLLGHTVADLLGASY